MQHGLEYTVTMAAILAAVLIIDVGTYLLAGCRYSKGIHRIGQIFAVITGVFLCILFLIPVADRVITLSSKENIVINSLRGIVFALPLGLIILVNYVEKRFSKSQGDHQRKNPK